MTRIRCEELSVFTTNGNRDQQSSRETRIRCSPDFLDGRYASDETFEMREYANDYDLDFDSGGSAFADLDALGMVTPTHSNSAFGRSPYRKDMPVAFERRRGRDEIGGREAAPRFQGNSAEFFPQFLTTEAESASLNRDLEIAKEVQRAFIPQDSPAIPGLTCETFYRPAYSVGGDYYDFFPLRNGHWGIAMGDVSGKGIGAALMMASLHTAVRAQVHHPNSDPKTLIRQVNRLVHQSSPAHSYAALVYAEYDPSTRRLEYINAGHNPPFVVRCDGDRSKVLQLNHGGAPLGIFADSRHHATPFQLESGDTIVACTDGVTEAENRDREGWGQPRLENLFSSCRRRTARQALDDIVNEVTNFVGDAPQKDDMTVVVIAV